MRTKTQLFHLEGVEERTAARLGRLTLAHGTVRSPAFMPVGTQGSVKGLFPKDLAEMGAEILLANAYHLYIRPGISIIEAAGGLHKFMGWSGPLLTDSGGYQVFSLARLQKVSDEGVRFRAHFDGREHFLSPERVVELQEKLGVDVAMVLDQCPPYPAGEAVLAQAVERTLRWARRSRDRHARGDQALFGILQGGLDLEMRLASLRQLVDLDFDGYAIGGLSVGEPRELRSRLLPEIVSRMPEDRPRYLMGVGTPLELLEGIAAGVDLFDCVSPTRYGRNGSAFTRTGRVVVRNASHAEEDRPLDEACACYVCRTFSRSYLRHLFNAEELSGPVYVSYHNVFFFLDLMREARDRIAEGSFREFAETYRCTYSEQIR